MLRFFIVFWSFFLLVPSITIDESGGVCAKAKAAGNAAKKAGKKAKKAANKAKKAVKKGAKKVKAAGKKAKAAVKKGAKKAKTLAKKGANKAKKAAKAVLTGPGAVQNIMAGIQMGKKLKDGDIEGAAKIGATAAGHGETFDAAKGAVSAAKDGDWKKAATQGVKAGAYGSGNAATYDDAKDLVDTAKKGDDEETARAIAAQIEGMGDSEGSDPSDEESSVTDQEESEA